jgi:hypothetical protein
MAARVDHGVLLSLVVAAPPSPWRRKVRRYGERWSRLALAVAERWFAATAKVVTTRLYGAERGSPYGETP